MKKVLLLLICLLLLSSCTQKVAETPKTTENFKVSKADTTVFEYGDLVSVKDVFKDLNLIDDDVYVNTKTLGENSIKVGYYDNNNEVKVKIFKYTVVDTIKPLIWIASTIEVDEGYTDKLENKAICTDNYDTNPECYVSGYYNTALPGTYDLKYVAIDSSGNRDEVEFKLKVNALDTEEPPKTEVTTNSTNKNYILFSDVYKEYKTDNTLIGIDVSMWQGDINWKEVKADGVEFAIIRLGYQYHYKSDAMELDPKFIQNIEGALANDIPVGVYFYSFATTDEEAKSHANFVINNIKNYNVTMPIAYDWENFSKWNEMDVNLSSLRSASYAFQDTIKEAGYRPVQYGSRNYLYSFWYPIKYETWLAHYLPLGYTSDFKGSYVMWQLCNTGRVDGISGDVDIDVYYK